MWSDAISYTVKFMNGSKVVSSKTVKYNKAVGTLPAESNAKVKKKGFTVSYGSVSGAKGYEILYSTKADMKKAKKVASTKTSATVSGLSSNVKYYVQVRAYKLDSTNAKVYSSVSGKKTTTTK